MVESSFARMITRTSARLFAIFATQITIERIAILTFVITISFTTVVIATGTQTIPPTFIVAALITRVERSIPINGPRITVRQITRKRISSTSPIAVPSMFCLLHLKRYNLNSNPRNSAPENLCPKKQCAMVIHCVFKIVRKHRFPVETESTRWNISLYL